MRPLAFAFLSVVAFADLTAQQAATLALSPSTRIRVTQLGSSSQVVGRVIDAQGDTLRFANDAGVSFTPLHVSQIAALDTSAGQRTRFLKGALTGIVVGGAALGITSALTYTPCATLCLFSRSDVALMGMAIGAVGGAVLGGLVGLGITADRWKPVIRDKKVSFFKPVMSPTRAGLKLRF